MIIERLILKVNKKNFWCSGYFHFDKESFWALIQLALKLLVFFPASLLSILTLSRRSLLLFKADGLNGCCEVVVPPVCRDGWRASALLFFYSCLTSFIFQAAPDTLVYFMVKARVSVTSHPRLSGLGGLACPPPPLPPPPPPTLPTSSRTAILEGCGGAAPPTVCVLKKSGCF